MGWVFPRKDDGEAPPAEPSGPIQPGTARQWAEQIGAFVREESLRILARNPRIVGFSSVFQQNLSCIALAREIKSLRPEVITVLGGANAAEPMGSELREVSAAFDYVFSGDADFAFPEFCARYLSAGVLPAESTVDCATIFDLDRVFSPDYDDYFEQLAELQEAGSLPREMPGFRLYFESSRGCWWGAKSHCTFCGLNGLEIRYRQKSAERVVHEIGSLVKRYDCRQIHAADNIMPHGFRSDVLPALAASEMRGVELFYEVKSNLSSRELDLLQAAGILSVQPGIESLSSNVLKHLAKGVSGPRNLWLLRECAGRRINVEWNFLVGVAGETAEDYRAALDLIPLIVHLQPPQSVGKVRPDRYSPYYDHPERYGLRNLKPQSVYEHLYPAGARVDRIAYHFQADVDTEYLRDPELQKRFLEANRWWHDHWHAADAAPRLVVVHSTAAGALLLDSRPCSAHRYSVIPRREMALLRRLERPRPRTQLSQGELELLGSLLDRALIVSHEGLLMSVVVHPKKALESTLTTARRAPVRSAVAATPV